MIRINLLAERRPGAAKVKAPQIQLGASAENLGYIALLVGTLLFCGYQWYSLSSERARLEGAVENARQEVEKVREGLRIIADLEAKKALIDKQVDIISGLKKARAIPVTLMNEINATLPDFLWFTSMAETGNQISFAGRATTANAPANLYNNLTASPLFTNVTLNQITKDATGVNFSLTCTFRPDGQQPSPQG